MKWFGVRLSKSFASVSVYAIGLSLITLWANLRYVRNVSSVNNEFSLGRDFVRATFVACTMRSARSINVWSGWRNKIPMYVRTASTYFILVDFVPHML